jgi:hypothetical protein
MGFTAEEISALMATELAIGLRLPPNRHFKRLWSLLSADDQQRTHAAYLHYRELRDPWVKWETVKDENRNAHWLVDMRLANARWRNRNFRDCWDAMSVLEKRLLRFLLVVELYEDAGRWREERRHLQRVKNLTVRE